MTIKNETIVDRVVERLQKQPLGDLITEEDLHDIVKEAIPKAFFQPRQNPNSNSYNSTPLEPLIVEIVRTSLKAQVEVEAKKYMDDHAEELAALFKRVLDDGFLRVADRVMDARINEKLAPLAQAFVEAENERRVREGRQQIYGI